MQTCQLIVSTSRNQSVNGLRALNVRPKFTDLPPKRVSAKAAKMNAATCRRRRRNLTATNFIKSRRVRLITDTHRTLYRPPPAHRVDFHAKAGKRSRHNEARTRSAQSMDCLSLTNKFRSLAGACGFRAVHVDTAESDRSSLKSRKSLLISL